MSGSLSVGTFPSHGTLPSGVKYLYLVLLYMEGIILTDVGKTLDNCLTTKRAGLKEGMGQLHNWKDR